MNIFKIIGFEDIIRIRGTQLVNNKINANKEHTPFAFLENQGQLNEAYRRIDCILIVKDKNICKNCEKLQRTLKQICQRLLTGTNYVKTVHASKDILIEKVKKQRKVIRIQNETILNMRECLEKKIKNEEIEVSDEMANIIYTVTKNITSENINISN